MNSRAVKTGHFPPEFYEDLPIYLQMRVCRCITKGGWTKDTRTGWWVCDKCNLPSRFSACRKCEGCDKWFIPLRNPNRPATAWADSCPDCFPELESKE